MEIEFQGLYDKATVFVAVRLANKPTRRNAFIRIGLAILFIAIYIAYFISVASEESLSSFEIIRSGRHLITLPVIAYFLFQPAISSYQSATNLWKNPTMQKPLAGAISGQGVAYISPTKGRREVAWESFAKKQVAENLIVLLTADGVLSIFPRHFFKSDDDWKRVKQGVDFKVVEAS